MIVVGKRVADDFYVHRSYIDTLEEELRNLYEISRRILNPAQKDQWNLVKINLRKKRVSFLHYPQFDEKGHPELKQSISINLSISPPTVRIIKGGGQILHRKELFVDKDYKYYLRFAELTSNEEELGLLNNETFFKGKKLGTIMGRKVVWEEWLRFNRVNIKDHKVIKTANNPRKNVRIISNRE